MPCMTQPLELDGFEPDLPDTCDDPDCLDHYAWPEGKRPYPYWPPAVAERNPRGWAAHREKRAAQIGIPVEELDAYLATGQVHTTRVG
jgi:hypothetical protein